MAKVLLRASVALLPLCPLAALDPALRISQYHKQYWQVEQGLPHSYVTAVAQDHEGFLLIGTDEGMARFDGQNFRALPSDPALRLSQRWTSALLSARDHSLWIGAFDGQLLHLRDGKTLRKYEMKGSVFDLREDSQGRVWASTRDGVYRIDNGNSEKLAQVTAPSETSWNVLTADERGQVWIVCSDGLFVQRGSLLKRRLKHGGNHAEILSARAARSGGLWLGTSAGLFRLGEAEDALPQAVSGVRGPVVSLLEDRDGVLWAGSWGQGLFRVNNNTVESWTARDGLPDDFIRTLAEDNEGDVWIGTRSGGLGRWKDTRIVPLGAAEGMAGNYATTVMADPRGDLWLGTWRGGLYRIRNHRLESQPTPFATLYFTLRALAFDAGGHQWFGNWEGLFQFDGSTYRRYAASPDSAYHRVSALLFDRIGGLWVGTADHGVFRFASGIPSDPPPPSLLPKSEITALLEDSSGRVWVGSSHSLGFVAGHSPGSYRPVPGLPDDSIESIYEDSDHRIWATTAGGLLCVIADGRATVLDRRNGLPGHALYRFLEDASGSYWISSPRGIFELRRESVDEVLAGRRVWLNLVQYDLEDGLRTVECHGLSQPAGWRDRAGSLWFPTARGFVEVRAGKPHRLKPPRVLIEEAKTSLGTLRWSDQARIEAGARDLEIQFTALRFSTPRKVRFRYRMGGFDPDWVDSGTLRSARYNQLPPGVHLFEVQARDPAGDWSESARLIFQQEPRFHQTWWFLFLLALASGGIVVAIYRWRLHTVRLRYAAVMEERNRIGREWHDTLVAGFSAISLQLEAAMVRLNQHPARASEILDMTRKMVHHYRAEARRVIWDLRDNRPEEETLPVAVELAMKRVAENRGIEGAVVVEGAERELPVELRHNVLRICQEAMSNAARHGSPTRIDILLHYGDHELKVRVRDNGCGFNYADKAADATGHFGLTVMHERARRFGGILRVESRPAEGTTIEAVIPLTAGEVK